MRKTRGALSGCRRSTPPCSRRCGRASDCDARRGRRTGARGDAARTCAPTRLFVEEQEREHEGREHDGHRLVRHERAGRRRARRRATSAARRTMRSARAHSKTALKLAARKNAAATCGTLATWPSVPAYAGCRPKTSAATNAAPARPVAARDEAVDQRDGAEVQREQHDVHGQRRHAEELVAGEVEQAGDDAPVRREVVRENEAPEVLPRAVLRGLAEGDVVVLVEVEAERAGLRGERADERERQEESRGGRCARATLRGDVARGLTHRRSVELRRDRRRDTRRRRGCARRARAARGASRARSPASVTPSPHVVSANAGRMWSWYSYFWNGPPMIMTRVPAGPSGKTRVTSRWKRRQSPVASAKCASWWTVW